MKHVSQEDFAAFVGLDWADAKHDICIQATGSEKREDTVGEPLDKFSLP